MFELEDLWNVLKAKTQSLAYRVFKYSESSFVTVSVITTDSTGRGNETNEENS